MDPNLQSEHFIDLEFYNFNMDKHDNIEHIQQDFSNPTFSDPWSQQGVTISHF